MELLAMRELGHLLSAGLSVDETLSQLNDELLPIVIERMNNQSNRRLWALYDGERIPENETNLTDTRGRVSLLIEHTLVDVINSMLAESGEENIFLANVVANRFPDLEIRQRDGRLGLRFEVKALQATAEEKSANFSTLKKDVRPQTDFLIIFVWEWNSSRDSSAINWDRAPLIIGAFALHASSLATMRDTTWLDSPPANVGDAVQGFDLLEAITASNGKYKGEEGNLGKLMRVFDVSNPIPAGASLELSQTISRFKELEDFVISAGFDRLCELIAAASGSSITTQTGPPWNITLTSDLMGFALARRLGGKKTIEEAMKDLAISKLVVLRDKYQWTVYALDGGQLAQLRSGRKPKELIKNPL